MRPSTAGARSGASAPASKRWRASSRRASSCPRPHRDPEDAASGGEIQKRVQQALLELPPGLRMAVVLYDIEGQSYSEIAEALRIPEGTVKSRIHRARSALRGLLRPLASAQTGGVEP